LLGFVIHMPILHMHPTIGLLYKSKYYFVKSTTNT
jgi:hypothetical protein